MVCPGVSSAPYVRRMPRKFVLSPFEDTSQRELYVLNRLTLVMSTSVGECKLQLLCGLTISGHFIGAGVLVRGQVTH